MLKFIILLISVNNLLCDVNGKLKKGIQVNPPPSPKHGFREPNERSVEIYNAIDEWNDENEQNIWELSGLIEGDMMFYEDHTDDQRNGLLDEKFRWKNSTVPFYIDENDFNDDEIKIILNAIDEYHNKTCIRFRPYDDKIDKEFIVIKGNSTGCWSSVGMQDEGQVVHLQTPNCVRHGVVVHELLHALGFYHQQSATERDEYVKIHYENILPGREHNFNKYNSTFITNYNISYDYGSVMHYSEKAFSKNGKITIEALQENVKLGQRKGLSEKDIEKLNKMYETIYCHSKKDENYFNPLNAIISWFEGFFNYFY